MNERSEIASALEQMAGPARTGVDEACVTAVGLAERACQRAGVGRNEHEVDVVGHQAIGPHLDRGLAALLGEEIAIERVVGRFEEDRLTAVAALGHVMRMAGDDDTGEACHARSVEASQNRCNG
jgi:hypothetical protein